MSETTTDPCEHQINAAAWVLGALDESDVPGYAAHVDTCRHCQTEIAKLTMVRDALPLASEQIAPPPQLGDRIMAIVSAEAELLRAAGPQADRPAAADVSRRGRRGAWLGGWRLAALGAAVLAVGLVIGGVVSSSGGGERHVTTSAHVTVPGARAVLVVDGTRARLRMTGMPIPPEGRVYEVWVLRDGSKRPTPTNALFSVRSSGAGDVGVPAPLHAGDQVLVTAERSGGSNVPTSPPVIAVQA